MGNFIEPDGCAREIDRCYGDHNPNGHYYAKDVTVFYPTDTDKPNLVTCPAIERGRCGVRARLKDYQVKKLTIFPHA